MTERLYSIGEVAEELDRVPHTIPKRWVDYKVCYRCKENKHRSGYNVNRKRVDGLSFYCKTCTQKARKDRYWKDPEKGRQQSKDSIRKSRFGIEKHEYQEMVNRQNNLCAICNELEKLKSRNGTVAALSIDHDHETGAIRALLCRKCNFMIGCANDDPELLKKAIEYLYEYK